jgi:hypothetical protein
MTLRIDYVGQHRLLPALQVTLRQAKAFGQFVYYAGLGLGQRQHQGFANVHRLKTLFRVAHPLGADHPHVVDPQGREKAA